MRITAGPYLQDVKRTSMTVMWHTDEPGTSRVEFERAARLGWSEYAPPAPPTYPECREEPGARTVHAVTLTGLEHGWCYHYRVASRDAGGEEAVSEGATFRTAPDPGTPFRFVTYGDALRSEHHGRVAALARSLRPDLGVGAGDMSQDRISTYPALMFEPAAEFLRYTPWRSTMGNHDSPNEGFFRYFRFPQPHCWHSFDYSCAHFTLLNTCMDYRPGSEQWLWLEEDLRRAAGARWKFVVFHHPPYCSSSCEIQGTRVLCPVFERHGVDVVFNAHATRYERSHPLTGGRYDGAGGVVYFVTGGGGHEPTLGPSIHWDHLNPTAAAVKTANHLLLVSVAPDEVAVQAIDEFGAIFDTARYTKPAGARPWSPAAIPAPAPAATPEPGTRLAGLVEGDVNWVLPRPAWRVDDQVTRGGGPSIRLQQETPGLICPAIRRVICEDGKAGPVAGGRAFAVSARVRTKDLAGGVTVGLEWSGDMGFLGRVQCVPVQSADEWTRVEVVTPVLPGYVYWCRVVLSALPGTTGTAWFDEVDVRAVE